MAPEQYDGREATAMTDQFSFCVALWEALLGARPYAPRVEDGTLQRVEGRADGAPVPVWLLRAVDRGLSLDPQQRYPSMEAVLEALARDPARGRSRRLRFAAAAAVPLLIAGAASWWVTTRADRLCKGAHAQVESVWSPQVADGIGRAFAASGADDAVESWNLARERLGAWFTQWEAM